jgi:addiction module RelE/StbE family toxin
MAFKIEYIATFHFDVLAVVDSLEEYPQKAKRIFEKLDRKLVSLAEHPEMYPIYDDFPDFRKIVLEDYLIFYSVNERDKIIEIHRFIYGRMDIKTILSGNSD